MADCERHINEELAVESLCRDTVKRLRELQEAEGARLKY